jgi:methyltransferase family protein
MQISDAWLEDGLLIFPRGASLMSEQSAPPQPPRQARLAQMATGFILSRIVYTAASFGIADHLASSPKSARKLATPTGCDAVSLVRFMRTLTNFGILALGDDGRFSLTPLGEPLRSDVLGSVPSSILSIAGQWSWQAWEAFPSTVKTGKPAVDMVFGMPVFDWLAQHPDEAKRFSETMVAVHGAEPPAVERATRRSSSCTNGIRRSSTAASPCRHDRSSSVTSSTRESVIESAATEVSHRRSQGQGGTVTPLWASLTLRRQSREGKKPLSCAS